MEASFKECCCHAFSGAKPNDPTEKRPDRTSDIERVDLRYVSSCVGSIHPNGRTSIRSPSRCTRTASRPYAFSNEPLSDSTWYNSFRSRDVRTCESAISSSCSFSSRAFPVQRSTNRPSMPDGRWSSSMWSSWPRGCCE